MWNNFLLYATWCSCFCFSLNATFQIFITIYCFVSVIFFFNFKTAQDISQKYLPPESIAFVSALWAKKRVTTSNFPSEHALVKPVMQLKIIITALQRSCGKAMFSVVSVCYSACPQRGSPRNYTWTCTNLRFVKASGWPSTERPSCYHTRSVTCGTKLLEINLFIQLDTSFDSPICQ